MDLKISSAIKLGSRCLSLRYAARLFSMLLIALFISACSSKEETEKARQLALTQQMEKANDLLAEGNSEQAIQLLEKLSEAHPNQVDVLETLAFAYANKPDSMLAAFYFEQVFRLDPSRAELLTFAAKSYLEEQKIKQAVEVYVEYLRHVPGDWMVAKELASLYGELNRPQDAIACLSAAFKAANKSPTAKEAYAIGSYYQMLGNPGQARQFFNRVIEGEASQEDKAAALLQLFQYEVEAGDYGNAKSFVDQLKTYPEELKEALQNEAYQAMLQEAEKRRDEEAKRIAAERQKREAEAKRRAEEARLLAETTKASLKKIEAEKVAAEELKASQPAPKPPETIESLIEKVVLHREGKDYVSSVEYGWKAINMAPERAESWHELAMTYSQSAQYLQAEATILEAIRLQPQMVHYRLTFLRIIQKSKPPEKLLEELENAYEDMPNSPEIILALARGYEKILKNKRNAHYLYTEFLEKAPLTHPDRGDAEAAMRNLAYR